MKNDIAYDEKLRLLFFFKSNVRGFFYKQKCKNVKHMFFQINFFKI